MTLKVDKPELSWSMLGLEQSAVVLRPCAGTISFTNEALLASGLEFNGCRDLD
jgi:hypothetical protein